MSPRTEKLPHIDAWQPLQLQLVAFTKKSLVAEDQDWLHELTGADCESIRKRLERADSCVFENRQIRVGVDPMKVLWVISPNIDPNSPVGQEQDWTPTLGPFPAACEWFGGLAQRWLEGDCPEITRLGFSAKLFQRMADRETTYQMLNRYLTDVTLSSTSSDFLYRINRKRQSKVISTLLINRLTTWASIKIEIRIQTEMTGDPESERSIERQAREGCLLDVDINTDPEHKDTLPKSLTPSLLVEMMELASELSAHGDIP